MNHREEIRIHGRVEREWHRQRMGKRKWRAAHTDSGGKKVEWGVARVYTRGILVSIIN